MILEVQKEHDYRKFFLNRIGTLRCYPITEIFNIEKPMSTSTEEGKRELKKGSGSYWKRYKTRDLKQFLTNWERRLTIIGNQSKKDWTTLPRRCKLSVSDRGSKSSILARFSYNCQPTIQFKGLNKLVT